MSSVLSASKGIGQRVAPLFEFFTARALTRGWPYLTAWAHRISGIVLVLYVWFHIITLSGLSDPEGFDEKMKIFGSFFFVLLEWLLSVPVIFHALNGGKLLLYELFENRWDEHLFKWVLVSCCLYIFVLGFFMVLGDQTVSASFFWLYTGVVSVCLGIITAKRLWDSRICIFWKLQRVSGAFLVLMVPAHMVFMHLNPSMGHDSQMIIQRMNSYFIKVIDCTLLLCVLYHSAYGLYSMAQDYLHSTKKKLASVLILAATLVFAWMGIKLIVMV